MINAVHILFLSSQYLFRQPLTKAQWMGKESVQDFHLNFTFVVFSYRYHMYVFHVPEHHRQSKPPRWTLKVRGQLWKKKSLHELCSGKTTLSVIPRIFPVSLSLAILWTYADVKLIQLNNSTSTRVKYVRKTRSWPSASYWLQGLYFIQAIWLKNANKSSFHCN